MAKKSAIEKNKRRTKMAAAYAGRREALKATIMDRAAQPSEIAPAYIYLACNESSYMTGQTLHLNGGVILNT